MNESGFGASQVEFHLGCVAKDMLPSLSELPCLQSWEDDEEIPHDVALRIRHHV